MSAGRSWFGHPPGLTILFLTEMWEKFSYYGMRSLLVYYMVKALAFEQAKASLIYGFYTAFVYLTPIAGGLFADRVLGRRRAVMIGAAIMAIGHFVMAFESLLYVALALIAIGNGLFLPSLPSQVSSLYQPGDRRIDSAYSIYYVGINLGAFLAPIVCGTLGETLGWHWGFGAAGVGMLVGLVLYASAGRFLPLSDLAPRKAEQGRATLERDRFVLLFAIMALVVLFRGAYEQLGNTVALWADSGVARQVGELTIPMTWFQSLDPLLVFALTPFLVRWWDRRARRGAPMASAQKMALGATITGVAYAYLALLALAGRDAPWAAFVGFFVLFTVGELFILPIGLSLFGRLAPTQLAATMIAFWFSAAFAGNLLAGALGTLWSSLEPPAFFALMALIAACPALGFLWLDLHLRKIDAPATVNPVGAPHTVLGSST